MERWWASEGAVRLSSHERQAATFSPAVTPARCARTLKTLYSFSSSTGAVGMGWLGAADRK